MMQPAPMPAMPDFTFTGAGTNVAYVDSDGRDSQHNMTGRAGIEATAPGTNIQGIAINDPLLGGGRAPQILSEAGQNNHIVAGGFGTSGDAPQRRPTYTSAMEGNPQATYIFAASPVNGADYAISASNAVNGVVGAAVRDDQGTIGAVHQRDNGADGHTCAPTGTSSCISVNMSRGSWSPPRGRIASSWAVAKLAGYAALLREAFAPANGAELVRVIMDGANRHNVFSLKQALENAGLGSIGNGQQYANVMEPDSGGGAHADTAFAGWTAVALAGPRTALPVLRNRDNAGLGFAAFATPDAGVGGGHRVVGFTAGWRGLRWGALIERDGFLGRSARALLGASRGRWTWAGWSGEIQRGSWRFTTGLEMGIGTADASRSAVIEDYGNVVTSAWRMEAKYASEGLTASLSAHQPPRTERARIRLRHGEGTVRERPGREVHLTSSLKGASGWTISFTEIRNPGHEADRESEKRIRAGWRLSW